jgi:hypothetical protein
MNAGGQHMSGVRVPQIMEANARQCFVARQQKMRT